MQLRIFQARLDPMYFDQDQHALNDFMDSVTVKKTATQFIPAEPDFWSILVFYEKEKQVKKTAKPKISDVDFTDSQKAVLNALKAWRKEKAEEAQIPEFMVCPNSALNGVVEAFPRSIDDLRQVKGFGESKINRYGDDILAVVNAF